MKRLHDLHVINTAENGECWPDDLYVTHAQKNVVGHLASSGKRLDVENVAISTEKSLLMAGCPPPLRV